MTKKASTGANNWNQFAAVKDSSGTIVTFDPPLPSQTDLRNPVDPSSGVYIGTKPTVTATPRVIHGDVKY